MEKATYTIPMFVASHRAKPFPEKAVVRVLRTVFVAHELAWPNDTDDDHPIILPTFEVAHLATGMRFPSVFRYKARALAFAEWVDQLPPPEGADLEAIGMHYMPVAMGAIVEACKAPKR